MRLEFKLKKKGQGRWKLKVLLIGILLLGFAGLYISPVGQRGIEFFKSMRTIFIQKANWRLNQVIVEGHRRTDKQTILKALGIKFGQEMNSISLSEARQNLLNLPWVKEVVVERHIPDTLIVRITEKTPVALWQNKQTYQPLDELGRPIKDDKLLPADLILVVGSDAPEHTLELLTVLEQVPSLNVQIRSAVRVEQRRWDLYLMDAETGLKIMLPETNYDRALKRLVRQNEKENLLKKNIEAVDLRLVDRIILHPKKVSKKGKKK